MDTQKKRPMGYADLSIVQLKTFADRGDARAKEELGKRLGMSAAAATQAQLRANLAQPSVGATAAGRLAGGNPNATVARGAKVLQQERHDHLDVDASTNVQASPIATRQLGQPPLRKQSGMAATSSANDLARRTADAESARATASGMAPVAGTHAGPNNLAAQTGGVTQTGELAATMSPQAAAALRQAEALLAAASPRMVGTNNRSGSAGRFAGRDQGGVQPSHLGANLLINDAPGASGSMSPELLAKLEEIARNAPDDDEPTPPVFLGLGMLVLGAIVALFGFSVTRGATGTWYFVACGLAMAASGWLYFKGMKLAVPVYALTCAMTVLWAVYESPTWLEIVLLIAVPLLIAFYCLSTGVRERLQA